MGEFFVGFMKLEGGVNIFNLFPVGSACQSHTSEKYIIIFSNFTTKKEK